MLNQIELNEIFDSLGIPPAGRRLIEKARRESPVRDVQSRLGNVITDYYSKKMGKHIKTESRSVEYLAAVRYEHDDAVIEYFEQPCKLDLILTDGGTKKPYRTPHTPDFLVIRSDQVLLEEWKEESRLVSLAKKYPGRRFKENGIWRFPEVEAQLADIGIIYRLRSGDEIPKQYVRNLLFLSDYMSAEYPCLDDKTIVKLREQFSETLVIGLAEFIAAAADANLMSDEVYKAIADGIITFDLNNDDISETHRGRVFRDEMAMALLIKSEQQVEQQDISLNVTNIEVGAHVDYEGVTYQIALIGEKSVMLTNVSGTSEIPLEALENQYLSGKLSISSASKSMTEEPIVGAPTPEEIQQVLERLSILENAEHSPDLVPVSKRTLQRYRKSIREAGDTLISQNIALVPGHSKKGNRQPKLPQEVLDSISVVIKTYYNKASGINKKLAYTRFLSVCTEMNISPCSQKTFNHYVTASTSIAKREGKRSEYQKGPIVWYLKLNEPIHGVRPFEYVHIDHTPLDIVTRLQSGKVKTDRVWLTLAIDAESRRIVGFYLTFDPPSYRSCMMVIRDIVRRHGRFPEMLLLDNGKEFKSRSLKRVCQLYGSSLRYRPAAKPRFGSVMERVFGTINSEFIHNLEGNSKLMKHVRTVTKSVRPEQFAEWTLTALYWGLDYYFETLYGTENHPAHGETPIEHFNKRMKETGMRRNRLVRYDRTFQIETCPSPDQTDTRIVDYQRGVKINYIWYWANAFRSQGLDGKPVEVRIDPWDVRYIYALINKAWHQCSSKLVGILRNYTIIELRHAFHELLRKHGIKKKDLTPERVAEWLRLMDAKNFDPLIIEQQREVRALYAPLGMTTVDTFDKSDDKTRSIEIEDGKDLAKVQESVNPKVVSIKSAKKNSKVQSVKSSVSDAQSPNNSMDETEIYELF